MLNRLWLGFFIASFIACLYQTLFLDNSAVFTDVSQAIFSMASTSVDIAIGLIGIMCLWLGIFNVLEQSHLIEKISRLLQPLFRHLMPEVPTNHPAQGAITMNLAANLLGLDNAATPMGIKAMQSLQTINPQKNTASNAQILFLVLNTSSVTLLPVTIFMYRAQAGSASATDVFLPILISTCGSTLAGLFAVSCVQKIKLYHPVVLAYLAGFALFMALLLTTVVNMPSAELSQFSSFTANTILFSFIVFSLLYGSYKKLPVYELFIDGAKQGFETAINLLPYLLAMLIAIAALRASGVLGVIIQTISFILVQLNLPTDFVEALPTGFMQPFSGSGARAMMLESFDNHGVDSFIGRLTSIMQGSTETTFYVLAVYFGSVGIRYGRHAVACGLIADVTGIIIAVLSCYWFFPV